MWSKYYDHEEAATAFAAEATGVVADKVAEEGLKLFTHGIKRIFTSRGIVYNYLASMHGWQYW